MPPQTDRLLHCVRRVASRVSPARSDEDAALLNGYICRHDEAAFAALVARHGPMVLRVCRRLLTNTHDADDAFQATFLILARKAASIRPAGSLVAWLHSVAYRVALGARAAAIRHRRREAPASDFAPLDPHPDPLSALTAREALQLLEDEVRRLPKTYRMPVVLCCLEGLSQEEAARRLGWTPGSLKGRLERGRKRLHRRLAARGLELAAALALVEVSRGASAGYPATFAASTAKAAAAYARGDRSLSVQVMALAESVLKPMTLARAKVGLLLLLAAGVTAAGAGTFAHPMQSEKQPPAEQQAAEAPKPASSTRTDRDGAPLPAGTIARLGTLRLRAVWGKVGLSPDGKTIITVTRGRLVKLWDADTGKLRQRRELPIELSDESFLSPDGRLLAVREGDSDPPIDIWDVAAGKRLHRLRQPKQRGIYRAAFSADGKTLAVAEHGVGAATIRLWKLDSGKEQAVLKARGSAFDSLAFSPDGKFLAAADSQHVLCWDAATGEQLWRKKATFGISLAFTPDGRTLIGSPGHQERAWHTWSTAIGSPAAGLKFPQGYNYAHLTIAPDGRTLVFAQGSNVLGGDGRVRLWDLRAGKLLHTLDVDGGIGPFFPDGKSFLTNDGALQRWELTTGRPLLPDTAKLGHQAEVSRAVYSPDGRRLASAARDGTIRLWDIATAKPLHILHAPDRDATDLAFTPDGKFLVSGGWGFKSELSVCGTETGKEVRRIPLHDPKRGEKKQNIWRLHVTPDGRTVIVLGYNPDDAKGGLEGILTTWDLETGRRKSRVEGKGGDGFYSAFSRDGRTLASRGELIDTETGKVRVKLEGAATPYGHYAFSPDGRLVAGLITRTETDGMPTTTKMDRIQIWDAASGQALRRIVTDWVGQLAFSPDGRYLAAADLQGLRLWELATGQVVMRHKAHERMRGSYGDSFASCLSFAPDGRSLATGHLDSTVLLWSLAPPAGTATPEELSRCWDALAGADAAKAYAASWRLSDAPAPALPFLRKRLRPAAPAPAEQSRPLLADLDSNEFRRREAAVAGLRQLGDRAETAMREALKAKPSLEMRRRLEALLKALEESPSGEMLRAMRAAAVLERIGTSEARELLKALAEGDPGARLTREAKASRQRLAKER
ncbi:MAG TPA: sigma-70 family RNA polymerase sigma factor [Gemmataceae bacterium]|jgi:RNA polymerase sigma factor (sigma-70 family)